MNRSDSTASPRACLPTPEPQATKPEINYLAKDYASFRQLILDRLALNMPRWQETHVPDLGIALVELLAYVGDYLSYYQDAVATEAYLNTARQRITVRRHVRLVDYAMHEGCNARAFVTIAAENDTQLDPTQVFFAPRFLACRERASSSLMTRATPIRRCLNVSPCSWRTASRKSSSTERTTRSTSTRGEIAPVAPPRGATSAALVDQWVPPPTPPPVDRPSAVSPPASASCRAKQGPGKPAATPG